MPHNLLRHRFRLYLAACTVAVLILSGCAGVKHKTTEDKVSVADVPHHRPWQPIPNPHDDLWIRVRNGYQMPAQSGHREIREWVAYYLTHDKHLSNSLRRAEPFLWHVVEALSARGLPLELALLPIVESGYEPSAVSFSGAGGLWQFMPRTGTYMGLEQNWWYDGRFDAMAATQSALDYLTKLHAQFDGNWVLALAAYNGGPGRVGRAIKRARARGGKTDFWHLDLPAETAAYVPKFFALRRLLAYPEDYNLDWPRLANRAQTATVALPGRIELDIAASMLDMPATELQALNPHVRRAIANPVHGGGSLLVPTDRIMQFQTALAGADVDDLVSHDWHRVRRGETLSGIARMHGINVATLRQINGLRGNRILVGQRLALPQPGKPATIPTESYAVQPGDTLWRIAHRYGIDVADLRRVNNLAGNALRTGQVLRVPITAQPESYQVQAGDTLASIAERFAVQPSQLRAWNRLQGNTLQRGQTLSINGPAPLPDFYHVQRGDTLWSIAQRFELQVATILELNDMATADQIRTGQTLRLQPAG